MNPLLENLPAAALYTVLTALRGPDREGAIDNHKLIVKGCTAVFVRAVVFGVDSHIVQMSDPAYVPMLELFTLRRSEMEQAVGLHYLNHAKSALSLICDTRCASPELLAMAQWLLAVLSEGKTDSTVVMRMPVNVLPKPVNMWSTPPPGLVPILGNTP